MKVFLIALSVVILVSVNLSADVLQQTQGENKYSFPGMAERPLRPVFHDRKSDAPESPAATPVATSTETIAVPFPNGDFEQGAAIWVEASQQGWNLILEAVDLPVAPHSGNWAAWLGGGDNEIATIRQQVALPDSAPYLRYWHWIASEELSCGGYDVARVLVNSIALEIYDLCPDSVTPGWEIHEIDLGAFAGQTVEIEIRVETDTSLKSDLYVDDVFLQYTPPDGIFSNSFEGLNEGSICTVNAQCANGLLCCYPCGIPGCVNQCTVPTGGVCPLVP